MQVEDDRWKDDLLLRDRIPIEEFNSMPSKVTVWLLENKHIFYNYNGALCNLLHKRNCLLASYIKKI